MNSISFFGKIMLSSLLGAQCRKHHFKRYNSISGLTPFTHFRFMASLEETLGGKGHTLEVSGFVIFLWSSHLNFFVRSSSFLGRSS